ncbi:1721_t:CDS:1, partial [Racocetra fulgida]
IEDDESIDCFDGIDSSYLRSGEANMLNEAVENKVRCELGSEECSEKFVCSSKKGKDYAGCSLCTALRSYKYSPGVTY